MTDHLIRNRQFLTDLFAGPFPGHGLVINSLPIPRLHPSDDLTTSPEPVAVWAEHWARDYEAQMAMHEAVGDASVPVARVATGTQIFAAAFGCAVHLFEESNPCALPLVTTAEEADALAIPDVYAPPLDRCFECGHLLLERLGPEAPIRVPDIQSPFDIAALIWRKQEMLLALVDSPEAVLRLVDKCRVLLTDFLREWRRQFPTACYIHCPNLWAPAELGCSLSEDEVGAMSAGMFEQFCLPTLTRLSEDFGGLFMHCCATADHQYSGFRRIPNLRGLNRVFQEPGPGPAIRAFAGETVLMQAWLGETEVRGMLDLAEPQSRFIFCLDVPSIDEGKRLADTLRPLLRRSGR